MGRHSKLKHRTRPHPAPKGMIEMVDARTGQNHLLTLDAAAAGRQAPHRYLTLCGTQILPAALVDPGTGYCWSCRSCTIPIPRGKRAKPMTHRGRR
jgi:hypothetical protein